MPINALGISTSSILNSLNPLGTGNIDDASRLAFGKIVGGTNANLLPSPVGDGSPEIGFYEAFYTEFLKTANSLPINSLWLIKIDEIPIPTVTNEGSWRDPTFGGSGSNIYNTVTYNAASNIQRKKGLVIAQGVKITGETINVERTGYKNTGFLQGAIGNGRVGLPSLNISFLENNISFVDYCLRPWCVQVSHNSLKNQKLKATINILFFTRTGVGEPLRIRKNIKYINCCPISIDEQEYNYSGSDMVKLRQVQFVFNHYVIEPVGEELLSLLPKQNDINSSLSLGRITNFAKDLARGAINNVVTNTISTIDSQINKAITTLTSGVRGFVDKGVNAINKAVDDAIGTSTILNNSSPDFNYVEKTINIDDHLEHAIPKIDTTPDIKRTVVNTDKKIKSADIPNTNDKKIFETLSKKINVNDVPNTNDKTIFDAFNVKIYPVNVPFKPIIENNNQNDTVSPVDKYDMKQKPLPPADDVRTGELNADGLAKIISEKDKNIIYTIKLISKDDTPISKDVQYIKKDINQDDILKRNG